MWKQEDIKNLHSLISVDGATKKGKFLTHIDMSEDLFLFHLREFLYCDSYSYFFLLSCERDLKIKIWNSLFCKPNYNCIFKTYLHYGYPFPGSQRGMQKNFAKFQEVVDVPASIPNWMFRFHLSRYLQLLQQNTN